jgi:CelD/BcsL family acetyltransferase involved in cellulose biosynthesis
LDPIDCARLSARDREAWQALARAQEISAPFLDCAWIESWLDAFRPPSALVLGVREADVLVAVAPVQVVHESWAGRAITVLRSLTNVESYRFDLLCARGRPHLLEEVCRRLCREAADVIDLDRLPSDSPTVDTLRAVAKDLGWRLVLRESFESPWRPLGRSVEDWDQNLKGKFKANLRNRERRIALLGEVGFQLVAGDDPTHERALEIFYRLEAGSWKGLEGTAIAQRPACRALYDRLVARAGDRVWIALLRVAGRAVAAQILRVEGGTLFMLKTAYDPEFAPYSPGQLLTARVIRDAIEKGFRALDFLASNMRWKSDWVPRLRPHVRAILFAPSANGRYAYWTRYGLREIARKVPGARQLARWPRSWGHGE